MGVLYSHRVVGIEIYCDIIERRGKFDPKDWDLEILVGLEGVLYTFARISFWWATHSIR